MSSLFDKLEALGIRPNAAPSERSPLKSTDLGHIETLFGYPIPVTYWEFQKRYGDSGFDSDNAIVYEVPSDWDRDDDGAPNEVRQFYGIAPEQESQWGHLASEIRSSRRNHLPHHFLPICESDGLATVVYISGRPQDYGQVFALTRWQIWDVMNNDLSTEQAIVEAYHIADSFEDFVSKLHADQEDD